MDDAEKLDSIYRFERQILLEGLSHVDSPEEAVSFLTALVSSTAKLAAIMTKMEPATLGQMLAKGLELEQHRLAQLRADEIIERAKNGD